ncbi:MAG: helix-turn-helix domain-containing protein [Alphaproteobacteria bacterium]|nr:helix-turn-helix domain-containing protein [Alphaproteobacteria bacterium]
MERLVPHQIQMKGVLRQARLRAQLKSVESGITFAKEGAPALDIFTVTTGSVKLSKLVKFGRRQVVGFLVPGEVFGFVPGKTYPVSAQAVGSVTVWRIPRRRLERLFMEFPEAQRQFLDNLTHQLELAREQIVLLHRKSARQRVAAFLLGLAQRQGNREGWVSLPMTRADIADYLGLSMETVSRVFSVLRSIGSITVATGEFRIVDANALTDLTERLVHTRDSLTTAQ